ncbi:MAG TPA: hypothetical protein VF546_14835 [Pyrinomonadaceae bacterium]|jgi:hypothetical protein
MPRTRRSILVLLLLLAPAACAQQSPPPDKWRPVCATKVRCGDRELKSYDISGMAYVGQAGGVTTFLVVHDSKATVTADKCAALVRVAAAPRRTYDKLDWIVDQSLKDKRPNLTSAMLGLAANPFDLEELAAVPDRPNTFMALSSKGWVYLVRLDEPKSQVVVLDMDILPDEHRDEHPEARQSGLPPYQREGLALQRLGTRTYIVWAQRGGDRSDGPCKAKSPPAALYWGVLEPLDPANPRIKITGVRQESIDLPWAGTDIKALGAGYCIENFRPVAALKVGADGSVYAASTVDRDEQVTEFTEDGRPFRSTVYKAGMFTQKKDDKDGEEFTFVRSAAFTSFMPPFPKHKIEALELMPGTADKFAFGTDDEELGSWLYLQ